ncbi:MAG: hypothetical protein JXJ18_07405, partial [Rhodobacteraceae bacterium]|nr:hypothetical protein [Paracoccaceae bacterium]
EMASPCERDHPACVLHGYMLLRLRADVLGQRALAGEAAKAETALRAVFPADAVTRLHGLLSGVPSLDSTHACLMLADRILKMLQEEAAPPTPGDDPAGQDRPDQPAAASSEGEKGDGQGEPSQKGANTGQTGADPAHRNALKAVLSAGDGDLRPDLFEAVENRLNGVSIPCSGTFFPLVEDAAADQAVGGALRQRVSVESARLRAALQGIVQASRLERPWHRRQGRRIDGRRLHRLASGDSRVFEQRLPKKAPNTAIHLLVDRSRSMNNKASRGSGGDRRVDIALRAALALTFALDGIAGVNPGATAFPGSRNDRVTRLLAHGRPAKTRAGAFALSASGSTPLDRALWYAASAVLACREERKVILTLTDGEPNNAAAALEIIQRCEASGIELAGIGIGIDVGHLFKRSAFIQTVDELGRKLF